MLRKFENDEEKFIRVELELQKTQDELLNNKDFHYLVQKSEELFELYYPTNHKRDGGGKL